VPTTVSSKTPAYWPAAGSISRKPPPRTGRGVDSQPDPGRRFEAEAEVEDAEVARVGRVGRVGPYRHSDVLHRGGERSQVQTPADADLQHRGVPAAQREVQPI